MKKQLLSIFMIVILLFSLIDPTVIFAVTDSSNDEGTMNLGLRFDDDTGKLIYEALNTAASSNTRYRTKGFIFRFDTTCDPKSGSPLTAECTPKSGTEDVNYVGIGEELFTSVKNYYHKDVAAVPEGKVWTVFTMSQEDVTDAFENTALASIKENTILYSNAVFETTTGGISNKDTYYTLSSIRKAKAWADKSGFRQYYDQSVTFHGRGK